MEAEWIAAVSALLALLGVVGTAFRVTAALRSNRVQSLVKLVEFTETTRPQRHILYDLPGDPASWTKEHRDAADAVARTFDILGIFDKEGMVPKRFLRDFYAVPVARSWKRAKSFIEQERTRRKQPTHLKAFQDLAMKCMSLRPQALDE